MLKLLRKLSWFDWLLILVAVGLAVLQVYCTMTLVDYVNNITAVTVNISNKVNSVGDITQTLDELTGELWFNAGIMLALAGGIAICQFVMGVISAFVSASFSRHIMSLVNEKVTNFSLAELNKFSTESLATRVTNDVQQIRQALMMLLRSAIPAPITAVWAIIKIQATSGELTLTTAVGIVLLVAGIATVSAIAIPQFKKIQNLLDKMNGITQENLTGIRVIRAYNAEDYQEKKFNDINTSLTKVQLFAGRTMAFISPIITLIMNGLTLALYWVGATLINAQVTDYAAIVSFIMLSSQVVMSFMMLLMMIIFWPRASVSANRIAAVLDTEGTIKDPKVEKPLNSVGEVTFDHVSFRYPDAQADVLEDITFTAKKGETVAFIGATGSGKSSLINLVTRLYDVTKGRILIDGVDIRDLKQKTLRSLIGFVPQKGILFSGSVRDNIALGNPKMSLAEVEKAAKVACADEFVAKMDKGYDSEIAQVGTNVSGGQRQRLCIARAVAIKPQILVFDDSFSALDFKTDRKVRDNLKEYAKDSTKLIVAQRIGTVMDADRIVVLVDGKVVGNGTHKELLQSCPTYRDIALSQLSKEELGL